MSIRDYSQKYVLINGITNEQIVVTKLEHDYSVNVELSINQLLLLNEILSELKDSESVTIIKSYMKA